MILAYGAKNFCCFKEWIDISFKVSKNCPDHFIVGQPISSILCVKGANGSGKTNALKVLPFLSEFCRNSFSYKPDAAIPFEPFFNSNEPSEFYIEFIINGITYRYELTVTEKEVISETLYRKQSRFVKVLERTGAKINYLINEYNDFKPVKLRLNASIISTGYQYEVSQVQPIYVFFKTIISNVNFFGHVGENIEVEKASAFYKEFNNYFKFAKDLIIKFDRGISEINIKEIKQEDGSVEHYPIFHYKVGGKNKALSYFSQSSGTKSLYLQLTSYKTILENGGLLVLDEFDTKLHPHILPLLLKIFTDKKSNKKKAQLIFSTHNSEILDLLGKYRTYLINKEDNESYVYRLDEIPGDIIRNDRPLMPIYNSGKIGGVPSI